MSSWFPGDDIYGSLSEASDQRVMEFLLNDEIFELLEALLELFTGRRVFTHCCNHLNDVQAGLL